MNPKSIKFLDKDAVLPMSRHNGVGDDNLSTDFHLAVHSSQKQGHAYLSDIMDLRRKTPDPYQ